MYTVPGEYTVTVPDGMTSMLAQTWGAGGGGGPYTVNEFGYGGGGGGGGGYARATISVTPGDTITIIVGKGGFGSSHEYWNQGNFDQAWGGSDTIIARNGSYLVRAGGGNGGQNSYGATGGQAATAAGSPGQGVTNPITHTGGTGAVCGENGNGGGGGGCANAVINGPDALIDGGQPSPGGNGGSGGLAGTGNNPSTGQNAGGGGGGGGEHGSGGKSGGDGQALISFQ